MMVLEHWQVQEHVDWHKSINMPAWIINMPEISWQTSRGDLATSPFYFSGSAPALPENHTLNKYEEYFKQIEQGPSGYLLYGSSRITWLLFSYY